MVLLVLARLRFLLVGIAHLLVGLLKDVWLTRIHFAFHSGDDPVARDDVVVLSQRVLQRFNHSALRIDRILIYHAVAVFEDGWMIAMLEPLDSFDNYRLL